MEHTETPSSDGSGSCRPSWPATAWYKLPWLSSVQAPGPNPRPPNSYELCPLTQVFEKANMPDQDLEVEGDLDGPGPDGASGPWAPSNLPTPAELEWDPAGDVGELGPSKQKTTQTPGPPCELCGHRSLQGRGQSLEVRAVPLEGSPTLPRHPQSPLCVL